MQKFKFDSMKLASRAPLIMSGLFLATILIVQHTERGNASRDKTVPAGRRSATASARDTAYVLDTRDFYACDAGDQSVQKTHRVDMVTRSLRRVIRDVNDTAGAAGFWARRGDTVLLDARDNIVTNLRHERMKKHLIDEFARQK